MSFLDRFRKGSKSDLPVEGNPVGSVERFRRGDITLLPFGDRGVLARVDGKGPGQLMSAELADLLERCDAFRTLDEHAAVIGEELRLGSVASAALRSELDELWRLGLLDEYDAVIAHINSTAEESPPQIETIGIMTYERPAALERCCLSHLENTRGEVDRREYLILDDSPSRETREKNRAMARSMGERFGVEINHVGPGERQMFVASLCKEGIPRHLLDFALLNPESCSSTEGANRNFALLRGAGGLALCIDDDTTSRVAQAPGASSRLSISSRYDPTELWFAAEIDDMIAGSTFESVNLAARHEQLLGRQPESLFAADSIDIESASPPFLRRLRCGELQRVLVTITGLVGDSGMYAPTYFLSLEEQSRRRFVEKYEQHRLTRSVLRVVPCPTITNTGFLITPTVGLDCREIVPPFFPVCRNSDGLFGAVTSTADLGLIGHLPFAVEHRPPEARAFVDEDIARRPAALRTTDVIQLCLRAWADLVTSAEPAERLCALGRHLITLGQLPLRDFGELLQFQRWKLMGAYADSLVELLAKYDSEPTSWADDIERVLDALEVALVSDDATVPTDLIQSHGRDRAPKVTQKLVLRYGELLQAWPEILTAARKGAKG